MVFLNLLVAELRPDDFSIHPTLGLLPNGHRQVCGLECLQAVPLGCAIVACQTVDLVPVSNGSSGLSTAQLCGLYCAHQQFGDALTYRNEDGVVGIIHPE